MRTPRTEIIYKELSYKIVGLLYKVHDDLGRYARENQYGDLFEKFLKERGIKYEREKIISKTGEDANKIDFLIKGCVVLEFKARPFIGRDDYYQVQRYLNYTGLKLGLLVNFRQKYLKPKRIINANIP